MKRRDSLSAAAMTPAAALPALAQPAQSACLPSYAAIKSRPANKIEILYKTKHGQPNGLALADNPGQMWVVDQGADHWITLFNLKDGSTVREFQADVVGPSGLVQDGRDDVDHLDPQFHHPALRPERKNHRQICDARRGAHL